MLSAAAVWAVAPQALGGLSLRGRAGPGRDEAVATLRALLPAGMPWRRLPVHTSDDALLGHIDLAATLAAGRPVRAAGLLAQAAGGVLVAAMAERLSPALAGRLCAALDGADAPALLLLDEGADDDERPPASLLDRVALQLDDLAGAGSADADAVAAARGCWRQVQLPDALLQALVATAAALGIDSARAPWLALQVTRIVAALQGRTQAGEDDAALAARLVLMPRATRLPPPPDEPPPMPDEADEADEADLPPPQDAGADAHADADPPVDDADPAGALDERLVEAVRAALPAGLLAALQSAAGAPSRRGEAGRSGQMTRTRLRGSPVGARRGDPRGGHRLALIDTLRAAAPWQRLRREAAGASAGVQLRRDDLHVQLRQQRRSTTTVFAIDASGSQALHRLAEAKGAVELLLADCYARRDRVAVVGFRGDGAQLLLPPTRSLLRARRQLAGLPGGGGTPLAAGIDATRLLVESVQRSGGTPLVVLLTDGRANVSRDGNPGREAARRDALASARALAQRRVATLVIDTSPQPGPAAAELAAALLGRCVVLPLADAAQLSRAVAQQRGTRGG